MGQGTTDAIATEIEKEWAEKTEKNMPKAMGKLNAYFDARDAYTKSKITDTEKVKSARKAAIRATATIPLIGSMRAEMRSYKRFFSDMITEQNAFSYKDILVLLIQDPKDSENCLVGRYDPSMDAIEMPVTVRYPGTMLHEMLHLYIWKMNGQERATCYIKLLQKVRNKIPQFDRIFSQRDLVLAEMKTESELPDPQTHDNLFFVKSLDLDIRTRKKLGTVYGYNMDNAIERIQREEAERQETKASHQKG